MAKHAKASNSGPLSGVWLPPRARSYDNDMVFFESRERRAGSAAPFPRSTLF